MANQPHQRDYFIWNMMTTISMYIFSCISVKPALALESTHTIPDMDAADDAYSHPLQTSYTSSFPTVTKMQKNNID